MANIQQLLRVEQGTKKKYYDKIAESRYFKGDRDLDYSLIFALAVSIGFRDKRFIPLKKTEWVTRASYVQKNNEMMNFFEMVAASHTKSLDALIDVNEIFKINEEYANGGIAKLYSMIFNTKTDMDFDKTIESLINAEKMTN